MAPTIHCVRHGQGFHNVGAGNYDLRDPQLTPLGIEQCLTLKDKHFRQQSHISLIVASPLLRTIQSAYTIFGPALESGKSLRTILAVPDAQETSSDPCDVGSDVGLLADACRNNAWPVDLSLVTDGWNDKTIAGRYSPSSKAISRRARDLRLFLRKQARNLVAAGDPDAHIVLVAHGGFMHYFTEDWENAGLFPGTGWVNCESRAYTFESGVNDDSDFDAHLVETMNSRESRGLNYPLPSREEQGRLYDMAMQDWENQGLQNHSKVEEVEEHVENAQLVPVAAAAIEVRA